MGGEAHVMEIRFPTLPRRQKTVELLGRICDREPVYSPRPVDKPLILYGAGNLGKMAKEYFDALAIPILSVVDTYASDCARDPFWRGVTIKGPEEVSVSQMRNSLLAVCVATTPYAPLAALLRNSGWQDVVPFYDISEAYRGVHPLGNGWFTGLLNAREREGIETVLRTWDDDVSRAHHLQLLAWRTLREEWTFRCAPVTTYDRYFIPEVKSLLTPCESFLDIGACYGETILRFLKEMDGAINRIWAVEPDQANLEVLKANLAHIPGEIRKRIDVMPIAVAELATEGRFHEGLGYASQLSSSGGSYVKLYCIDELGTTPSYIKLHLEGSELEALKGAQATLRRQRPIIAATTYHSALGLWELPYWLMERLEGYRFSMRLHSWCGTGAVMYAVPQERYHANGALQGGL